MAVISSGGILTGTTGYPANVTGSPTLAYTTAGSQMFTDYGAIYASQPAIRTVVSFLARNIAQLGLHAFRRVSDTDRQRLSGHPVTDVIARPNPWTTRYRLIDTLVHDLALYDNAYWLKVRNRREDMTLLRLPPAKVVPQSGIYGQPDGYLVMDATRTVIAPERVVHFRGYNPVSEVTGLSPLETLRSLIEGDLAASQYRSSYWRNAARHEGVLSRPLDAPAWSDTARTRFRAEFEALYTGESNSGRTAILEEGMTFTPTSFSAKDSQYLEARKLTREEVAAAYHIPLPMVGILDHATFSNVKEQHKQLYSDTLGPWLVQIVEEMALQLLPDLRDSDGVYLEFNLAEKLRGSFEEQADMLRTSVGAPWLTRNEARARSDLPALDGGDDLIVPLNITTTPEGLSPAPDAPTSL